jgi:hypothetical protein
MRFCRIRASLREKLRTGLARKREEMVSPSDDHDL